MLDLTERARMAMVSISLPVGLVEDAKAAGIHISNVCEAALRAALGGRHGARLDDTARYRQGHDLGTRWASTLATLEELAAIAAVRATRWHDLPLEETSLLPLLAEQADVSTTANGSAWLPRSPFSEGIVDAAATFVHHRV